MDTASAPQTTPAAGVQPGDRPDQGPPPPQPTVTPQTTNTADQAKTGQANTRDTSHGADTGAIEVGATGKRGQFAG